MSSTITLAVFASEKGPGDAGRASVLSQAGSFLARKGVRIVCPVGKDGISVPMVKSARAAGGDVLFLGLQGLKTPTGVTNIAVEEFADKDALNTRLASMADAYLGLPGSLASVTDLFQAWTATGSAKPVALLNHNHAFELVRGFAVDILAHGRPNWERSLQVSDNMEDLWNRLNRMLSRKKA